MPIMGSVRHVSAPPDRHCTLDAACPCASDHPTAVIVPTLSAPALRVTPHPRKIPTHMTVDYRCCMHAPSHCGLPMLHACALAATARCCAWISSTGATPWMLTEQSHGCSAARTTTGVSACARVRSLTPGKCSFALALWLLRASSKRWTPTGTVSFTLQTV